VHAMHWEAHATIAGAKRGRLASERACTAARTPQARGLQATAQRCSPGHCAASVRTAEAVRRASA